MFAANRGFKGNKTMSRKAKGEHKSEKRGRSGAQRNYTKKDEKTYKNTEVLRSFQNSLGGRKIADSTQGGFLSKGGSKKNQ